MKTQNNNQETAKSQVSKLTLRVGAVLLSAVLVSPSVDAQDLWEQYSNTAAYGKMTLTLDEQAVETRNADAAIEAIRSEMAYLLSFSNEAFETAETEEPVQVESWMTDENFFNDAQQYTANGTDDEIAKYAEKIISDKDKEEALTVENWMTNDNFFTEAEQYTANGTNVEIAKYADKIIKNEVTEKSMTIESWMLDTESFNSTRSYDQFAIR